MNHNIKITTEISMSTSLMGGVLQDYYESKNEVSFYGLDLDDEAYNDLMRDPYTVAIWKPKSSRLQDSAWSGAQIETGHE